LRCFAFALSLLFLRCVYTSFEEKLSLIELPNDHTAFVFRFDLEIVDDESNCEHFKLCRAFAQESYVFKKILQGMNTVHFRSVKGRWNTHWDAAFRRSEEYEEYLKSWDLLSGWYTNVI
jgi:hypothetical protein